MTLNDTMAFILRYFTELGSFRGALRESVGYVYDVVFKKFTFAISSPGEFLVEICERTDILTDRHIRIRSSQYLAPPRGTKYNNRNHE